MSKKERKGEKAKDSQTNEPRLPRALENHILSFLSTAEALPYLSSRPASVQAHNNQQDIQLVLGSAHREYPHELQELSAGPAALPAEREPTYAEALEVAERATGLGAIDGEMKETKGAVLYDIRRPVNNLANMGAIYANSLNFRVIAQQINGGPPLILHEYVTTHEQTQKWLKWVCAFLAVVCLSQIAMGASDIGGGKDQMVYGGGISGGLLFVGLVTLCCHTKLHRREQQLVTRRQGLINEPLLSSVPPQQQGGTPPQTAPGYGSAFHQPNTDGIELATHTTTTDATLTTPLLPAQEDSEEQASDSQMSFQ